MVYGENASGKSNLLLAIQAVWDMLSNPKSTKESKINHYIPFALNKDKPTKFDIIFWIDKVQYLYSIEFNKDAILYERMEFYKKYSRTELFYERKGGDVIFFGNKLKLTESTKKTLIDDTLGKHTI